MYRSGIEGEWMKPRVSGSRVSNFKSEIVLHHHHHHHHLLHFCAVRLLRLTIIWIIEGSPHGKNHQIFRVKKYGLPPLNGWLVQGFVQNIQEVKYSSCAIYSSYATWWFPPIWKICSSNWMISLYRDENKIYLKPPPSMMYFFPLEVSPSHEWKHLPQDTVSTWGLSVLVCPFHTLFSWLHMFQNRFCAASKGPLNL